MPQMDKGGKWVFGWSVVGSDSEIQDPLEAYTEYGFQPGETLIVTHGSRGSGGFAIGRPEKLGASPLQSCCVSQVKISAAGQVTLPPEIGVWTRERLLAVRGSGLALGLLQHGPIYEEALKHPEIEIYSFMGKQ